MRKYIVVSAAVLSCLSVACGASTSQQAVTPPATTVTMMTSASSNAMDPLDDAVRALSEKGIIPLNPVQNKQSGVLTFALAETVCTGEYHQSAPNAQPTLTILREGSVVGQLRGQDITFEKLRTAVELGICWQF